MKISPWLTFTTLWLVLQSCLFAQPAKIRGAPATRLYSFEEIGPVSRGSYLTFDHHRRIAVVQDGAFVVLNDNTWINIQKDDPTAPRIDRAIKDESGRLFFGAGASWGRLEDDGDGRLRTKVVTPEDTPQWIGSTHFRGLRQFGPLVCFWGWSGVVVLNRTTGRQMFFDARQLSNVFEFQGSVYTASYTQGLQRLDLEHGITQPVEADTFGGWKIEDYVPVSSTMGVAWVRKGPLLLFKDGHFQPVEERLAKQLAGDVSVMRRLPEGWVALAIAGRGLFVVRPEGELVAALTSHEYLEISDLQAEESGVLWASTADGIAKVLYGQPTTNFSHAQGLPVKWPQIATWDNSIVVASGGLLYEAAPEDSLGALHFRRMSAPEDLNEGVWGMTVAGSTLVACNFRGIFTREPGGEFQLNNSRLDAMRVVALGEDLVFALGAQESGYLQRVDGKWMLAEDREPGFGFPARVLVASHSVWIELGQDRVARFWLEEGKLRSRLFDRFPWPKPAWINVSPLGDRTVLTSPQQGRLYFDEAAGSFVAAPEIENALAAVPHYPERVAIDEAGRWWLSHEHGVSIMTRHPEGFEIDQSSFGLVTERTPFFHRLPGNQTWASTGEALYVLDPNQPMPSPTFGPQLLHVDQPPLGREGQKELKLALPRIHIGPNNSHVTLHFFSGSYNSREVLRYEFSLNEGPWTNLALSSTLSLYDLRAGTHRLQVRMVDSRGTVGRPLEFPIVVAAHWYRTWQATAGATALTGLLVVIVLRLSLKRAARRNAELEEIVSERTRELKEAMIKLKVETEAAAIHEERNRLAGEIHDSLGQGFHGLMLQLESITTLDGCPPRVASGIALARNMVAHCRKEVRHAIWNMRSPVLETTDLPAALRRLASVTSDEAPRVTLHVSGEPRALGPTVEHHVLRIAQESITNVLEHAHASNLIFSLAYEQVVLTLQVKDDGCGFDTASTQVLAPPHFGLQGMKDRVRKMNGRLEILSKPGQGTTITVSVPLDPPPIL